MHWERGHLARKDYSSGQDARAPMIRAVST